MTAPAVPSSFLVREVKAFGRSVHRVGVSASFGLEEAGIEAAFERGVQYVFWNPTARKLTAVLRRLGPSRREALVVATGPSFGFTAGSVRRRVERALRVLRSDYLDVLQLYWLGRMSAYRPAVLEAMLRLKEEGKVRVLGTSIHDRVRAGELARSGPLDLLMIRYNAAHPGAEQDIFPHLAPRQPAVVAYTATSWRRLLRKPRDWSGAVPSAGDCYRFCLSNPHVDIVLMGARNEGELDENLRALERGPLSEPEMQEMRAFGRAVHG
ncbi:aldo/keto reductase [Sorangium cellulosum]|uniref:Aldo/keto reductase n=1 Tax=Sorangium cellulosum TaxID=56 RepID=A0A4V0NEP3_SORCE|nr:aldo/keto reductase [Sorangium cellulosum]AUX26872.1 aldo/keto reductase [Sorangium cellulosum]